MNQPLDFTGKRVLVVGGTSGIGNASAQAFRHRGAEVHVWGTRTGAEDYSEEMDSDFTGLHYQQMDVSQFGAVESFQPEFKNLDVLVLSQGLVLYKRQEYEIENFQKVLNVNLTSLMACFNKFRPMLEASEGSVIIVSSSAAFHATHGNPAYNASKAGATGLTRTLAQLVANRNVRVNAIAPGFIPTRMTKITTDNDQHRDTALQRIPMGRFGTPQEMAGVALFLASPLASYITGQTILADGGLLL